MRMFLQLVSLGIGAALAACSLDAHTYKQGHESCTVEGDEDGNGLADCSDPVCAGLRACQPGCGNGKVEAGEACDDGNDTDGDGCDDNCTPTGCGNGIETAGEKCDDGNLVDGDGCESTCKVTGSGRYEATSDAMIRTSAAPDDASTNYGTQPDLRTYGSSFGTVARALIELDLAALPPAVTIESAYLKVRLIAQAGSDFSIDVREVLAPWEETSVTWNNQPPFGAIEASLPFQGYTWWRFDVTALVQRWVDAAAAKVSVVLVQDPELFVNGGQYAHFGAREGTDGPYLEITVAP